MKKDLDVIDKKISILVKSILLIILSIILLVILGLAGYWGYSKTKTTKRQNVAIKQAEEIAAQKDSIKNDLSYIKHIGDTANLGDIELKLLEKKILATLPPNGKTGLLEEKERNVVGLKFVVKNISEKDQTFNRKTGWISTENNPGRAVDTNPFTDDEYVKQLGENYTISSSDLLIKPNETTESWIAVEVDTSLAKPVFLYPPLGQNSKWAIGS
ncbi:MAG TPA: hypothetical protein PK263_02050 [bacterium]|nr:hypothetical protein [bacterium]